MSTPDYPLSTREYPLEYPVRSMATVSTPDYPLSTCEYPLEYPVRSMATVRQCSPGEDGRRG